MTTLTDHQCEHTLRMAWLIVHANNNDLLVKVVEWNRLLATQKEYVAKGVSKTLNSQHLVNCATDLYIIDPETKAPTHDMELYRKLGEKWESEGGTWGGRFHDAVKWQAEHGRPFDPSKDIGWDPYHMESKSIG